MTQLTAPSSTPKSAATVGRMAETGIMAVCTMKLPRATASRLLRRAAGGRGSALSADGAATWEGTGSSCRWIIQGSRSGPPTPDPHLHFDEVELFVLQGVALAQDAAFPGFDVRHD